MIQDVIGEQNGRMTMEPFPCPGCGRELIIDALHIETDPVVGQKYKIRDILLMELDNESEGPYSRTSRRELIYEIRRLTRELEARVR